MFARLVGLFGLVFAATAVASPDHASWNADSPSFSCKAVHLTAVEARICEGQSGLWSSDRAMAALYKEASDRLDSQNRKALALQQHHWLKARERCTEVGCIASAYDERSKQLWELILASAKQNPVPVLGKTAQDRIAYLRFLEHYYENAGESFERYLFSGLKDGDPDVRSFVAFSVGGPGFLGRLIDVLVTEPDVEVRMSLALNISCQLTCNGTEPCGQASTVEAHLDNLLIAYKRAGSEPVGYSEEQGALNRVLTSYAGEDDWNKCLSPAGRERVRKFLSPEQ